LVFEFRVNFWLDEISTFVEEERRKRAFVEE